MDGNVSGVKLGIRPSVLCNQFEYKCRPCFVIQWLSKFQVTPALSLLFCWNPRTELEKFWGWKSSGVASMFYQATVNPSELRWVRDNVKGFQQRSNFGCFWNSYDFLSSERCQVILSAV